MKPLLAFGILGVVLVVGAVPLILGKVRPNPVYGFRTIKTLRNERLWYAANKVAGRDFLVVGLINLATAMTVGLALPEQTALNVGLIISLAALLVAAAHMFHAVHRMK